MNNINIKRITVCEHDRSLGGYRYKVVAILEVNNKHFKAICPLIKNRSRPMRALGSLVSEVNHLLYAYNNNIPAYNPSIDTDGHKRAVKGIKTMEFVYFFNDDIQAITLGMPLTKLSNGEYIGGFNQYISVLPLRKAA